MKAVTFHKYGAPKVLQVSEIEKPVPRENEILVRVHATSVTKYDTWVRSCTAPPGFNFLMRLASGRRPKQPILGTELAGVVAAVGEKVTGFQEGDAVFGFPGMKLGAYAEFICLEEGELARMPDNLSFEDAACVLQGAMTALYFLKRAEIQPGQKVLIFGASGGVGGYAVQLAKNYYGAEVTGVCSSAKQEYVRSLGADHVIDYRREDFTRSGQVYDVVFDTVGMTSISRTIETITEEGWYLLATFGLPMLVKILWISRKSKLNFEYGTLDEIEQYLQQVKELVENHQITPSIDRIYPLEQAADAHSYVESGQKVGNVVLRVV